MTNTTAFVESFLAPERWIADFGLLPVPLHDVPHERALVLLNGSRGNFCFDLRTEVDEVVARNEVWSADVAYRIASRGDSLLVHRWDQRSPPVSFRAEEVFSKFERFHRQLELQAPPAELSVVQHAINVYRSLRTALGDLATGEQSLQAFMALLACATDDVTINQINTAGWGLTSTATTIADQVRAGEWEGLLELLKRGRRVDGLEPQLALLLRHASGRLFQEAHYLAAVPNFRQLSIDGFAPDPAEILPISSGVGLHFTPSALARALVEEVLRVLPSELPSAISFFDPACGSGEFLREVLRQLKLRDYGGKIRLIGWDISPAACAMARFSISWESRHLSAELHTEIREEDAMNPDTEWPTGVSCILMNPPFLSWRDMDGEMRHRVLEVLSDAAHGARPDYAMAFLKRAADSLNEGGTVGTILPASLLDGISSAALRRYLGDMLSPLLIARLGSQRIFHEASVDPALYVAKRGTVPGAPIAFWADHRPTSASAALRALRRARGAHKLDPVISIGDGYSLYLNPAIGRGAASWAPRPYEQWRLLRDVSGGTTIGDLFMVRQGVITGMNRVFILEEVTYRSLPDDEKAYFRPAILNESFIAGRIAAAGWVFYPYGSASITSESELQAKVPTFLERTLLPNREALLSRKRITDKNWWLLSEYRAWQVERHPKIVTAYFGDVGSLAWDETGEYVVVQGYAWLPKGRSALPRSAWLAYLAILNSPTMSALLAASSNNVGGGQLNLSKRFVSQIPCVNVLSKKFPKTLATELARVGEQIHLGTFSWSDAHALSVLGELAEAAFSAARPGVY